MLVSEISLWGAALIAFLVFIASIALAFFDRQMLRRMLVIFGATVVQMAVVVAVVWLVYQTRSWWAYVIWILLVPVLSICWVLYPLQQLWKKMLRPVSAAMLVGGFVTGGSAMLCLPISVFLTVYSVLMACLTASMIQTMVNYQRSMHAPKNGQPSMVNGQSSMVNGQSSMVNGQSSMVNGQSSLRESILPQVRSMAQPLVMVMPMLYAGMLLGGVSPLSSLIVVLLLIAASFVANVLAGVVALLMLR